MVIFLLFSYWTIQLLIYILDDSVYNKPQGELAMGDISVIARRLSDKYVQYGWSGNAGYPGTVGARLWMYYNTPEMVEYLFGLGQLRQLCKPGSETSADPFRTMPTGRDDRRISELGQMAAQTDEALCLYENYELMESLRKLYYYFDPWAVVKTDKCGERINGVILSPRSNPRVETINWSE